MRLSHYAHVRRICSSSCHTAYRFGGTGHGGEAQVFTERSDSLPDYTKVIFKTFDMPATDVPILASLSSGGKTDIVMDAGDGVSRTKLAYDGCALPRAAMRGYLFARDLTEYMTQIL